MRSAGPIDVYMRELARELRAPRWRRRRILLEVRAHLLDAAEAERPHTADADAAAGRALARFGVAASETARQFNRGPSTRRLLLRRALVPWIAAVALTSIACASVWAFQPRASATRAPRTAHAAAVKPIRIGRARGERLNRTHARAGARSAPPKRALGR
ncbi:MAG TPA: hypothetical protein VMF09_03865 [Solirubrobacteraceae bacterium]|nr:hypothetical protein [Solirubrobacteraceae bacterium]